MEQDRKVKIISLVAVITAVIGLTLAFAAMSRTLKINGSANTDPVNWEIYFDNLSSPNEVGEGVATNTPSLATKGASITNMNVTLKKPGDSVTYTVDIVNNGDVDAEINDIDVTDFTSRQQELLDFKVVYTGTNNSPAKNDMLASKETKNITITFKYKDITDESKLPKTPEAISVDYSIEYVQSNNKVTTTESQQGGSNYGEMIDSKEISEGITATYYGGTPIAKADNGVKAMSYDNAIADDVRYEGGTLVISGSGAIPNTEETMLEQIVFMVGAFSSEDLYNNLNKYNVNGKFIWKYNPSNLIVEEGITEINSYSTRYKYFPNSLTSVILPSTLEKIGEDAFREQSHLALVKIPAAVNYVGPNAFSGIAENSIIYCETQEVANLLTNKYDSTTQVIVDPTKFN